MRAIVYFFLGREKDKLAKYHFRDQEEPLGLGQDSQVQRPAEVSQGMAMRGAGREG